MKELNLLIKKKGFIYTQAFKNEKGYIYKQQLNGIELGFEVFYRTENTKFNCISFPGDNAFGVWAWSVKTFDRALTFLK